MNEEVRGEEEEGGRGLRVRRLQLDQTFPRSATSVPSGVLTPHLNCTFASAPRVLGGVRDGGQGLGKGGGICW